jgi:pimeloyl-ACP methyl ester carboxylesterase
VENFVDASGVRTWYEEIGEGSPVLFLHGGIISSAGYADQRGLSRRHRLILPERRGHGHTPEVDGPISYQIMADDTVAFMDAIGLERAHIVGHSDGGIIGLLIAMAHPDRVDRLVPISANTNPDVASEPEMFGWMQNATDEEFAAAASHWGPTSPDYPARSTAFFGRMRHMFVTEPNITSADLARISAPTLILGADHDIMVLEDLLVQFRGIPNAQLAIVPGVTHMLTAEKPDLVNELILTFLAADLAPASSPGQANA